MISNVQRLVSTSARQAYCADSRTTQKACCTDCHAQFHGSNAAKGFFKRTEIELRLKTLPAATARLQGDRCKGDE
jgi:hypothetical protein